MSAQEVNGTTGVQVEDQETQEETNANTSFQEAPAVTETEVKPVAIVNGENEGDDQWVTVSQQTVVDTSAGQVNGTIANE